MDVWYVVFCKSKADEVAEKNLRNQGLKAYRPLLPSKSKAGEKFESMFPGYVFFTADKSKEINFTSIRSTKGVVNIVRFGNAIPTLTDECIEDLRTCEQFFRGRHALPRTLVQGDRIDFLLGKSHMVGNFYEYCAGERVKLLLEILGQKTQVIVPSNQLLPT
jgi:transcriptional antiterminator RfaH